MSLKDYNKKRDFRKTKEPKGKINSESKELIFVVQKHNATNLHYDFRLELNGVLKSWAVPKGPSLNPSNKRLAMMVEDHPYDYRNFEGIIPKDEYGGGEVIVWDKGTYHSIDSKDKEESEKLLNEGLKRGDMKFVLNGEKLKGEFVLVKMKSKMKNAWLLIKHKDKFSSNKDVLNKNKSVISGKTIEELQNNPNDNKE